jgi:hypothetical protein
MWIDMNPMTSFLVFSGSGPGVVIIRLFISIINSAGHFNSYLLMFKEKRRMASGSYRFY